MKWIMYEDMENVSILPYSEDNLQLVENKFEFEILSKNELLKAIQDMIESETHFIYIP